MTPEKYLECLRELNAELDAALRSENPDRILGTRLALETFLKGVKMTDEAPQSP